MLDPTILSPEVVAMIPGLETPQLDPRASKSPSPFSYGLQKTHLLLEGRMAQLGEGMAGTIPAQVHISLMALS